MEEYCLVVVRNKTDLVPSSTGFAVPEGAALDFIDELVPLSGSLSSCPATPEDETGYLCEKELTASPADPAMRPLRMIMGL